MRRSTAADCVPMAKGDLAWRSVAVTVLVFVALTITSPTVAADQERSVICNILASAVPIAHKAAQIIRSSYLKRSQSDEVEKSYIDFRNKAVKSAKQCMIASFNYRYPKAIVHTDPTERIVKNLEVPRTWLILKSDRTISDLKCPDKYEEAKENHITIWINPLDGMSEVRRGAINHATLLIGICWGGQPVAGVIYQIFYKNRGRAVWGLVGAGIGGMSLNLPPPPTTLKGVVYITTRKAFDSAVEMFVDLLHPNKVIRTGGVGNKVMCMLEGKAHVFLNPGLESKRWDTAAPDAVLRAAGGDFTDINGHRYSYATYNAKEPYKATNKFGIYATVPKYDRSTNMTAHINSILAEVQRIHMHMES